MTTALTKISTVEDLGQLGQIFVKSGFFADTRDAAQAIVKVMAGQELGFAPIASMTGVYIVKGKVSLSANLMAAAIKRSGKYNFRVRKLDAKECELAFFERAGDKWEEVGVSSFSIAEATQAGLTNNATWKNFPRNMLYARAMSNGCKWYCPDVFGGPIYTPDELGAVVDGETGEVIDLEPEPPAKPQPQPAKKIQPPPAQAEPTIVIAGVTLTPLTWDEVATIYDQVTGGKARTKPMDSIFEWSKTRSDLFIHANDCVYRKPEQGSEIIDAEIDDRPIDAITANQLRALVDLINALVEFHTPDAIRQSIQPLVDVELPNLDPANLETGITNAEAAKVISKLQKQLEAKRTSAKK